MDSCVLLEDSNDSSRGSNISLNGSCSTQCEDKIEEQKMGRNINVVNKILNRQVCLGKENYVSCLSPNLTLLFRS